MRRLVLVAGVALIATACSSGAGSSAGTAAKGTAPGTTMVSSTSIVLTAAHTTLKCSDQIGWPRQPPAGYSVVLSKVALPTKRAFGASRIHDGNPRHHFFAKQGLLIKPGASFELIVPAAWESRLAIGWGNPGRLTDHLWVTSCRSAKAGAHWLAFAGGFTLAKVACVPLIVKTATAQKTVHIGAGKACPGQAPPRK